MKGAGIFRRLPPRAASCWRDAVRGVGVHFK